MNTTDCSVDFRGDDRIIETGEEFFSYIKWGISNKMYFPKICNKLKFKLITFNENFNNLLIHNIDISKITPIELFKDSGRFNLTIKEDKYSCYFDKFTYHPNGLFLEEKEFGKTRLIYNEYNKNITYIYLDELHRTYSKNLINQIKALEKGYIKINKTFIINE